MLHTHRFSHRPLVLVLAEELWPKLDLYCALIWPYLRAPGTTTLFMSANGLPLTASRFTQTWGELLVLGKQDFYLPPNRLRHVFVQQRLDFPTQPGPSHSDAAAAMGNSVPTWCAHYHTTFASMAGSRAVVEMAAFRAFYRDRVGEGRVREARQEMGLQQEQEEEQRQQQQQLRLIPLLDLVGEDADDRQFF